MFFFLDSLSIEIYSYILRYIHYDAKLFVCQFFLFHLVNIILNNVGTFFGQNYLIMIFYFNLFLLENMNFDGAFSIDTRLELLGAAGSVYWVGLSYNLQSALKG